jgi:hypothetical protein
MIKAELYVLFGGSVWKVRGEVFEGVSERRLMEAECIGYKV